MNETVPHVSEIRVCGTDFLFYAIPHLVKNICIRKVTRLPVFNFFFSIFNQNKLHRRKAMKRRKIQQSACVAVRSQPVRSACQIKASSICGEFGQIKKDIIRPISDEKLVLIGFQRFGVL